MTGGCHHVASLERLEWIDKVTGQAGHASRELAQSRHPVAAMWTMLDAQADIGRWMEVLSAPVQITGFERETWPSLSINQQVGGRWRLVVINAS
jgi:hypothetical protein